MDGTERDSGLSDSAEPLGDDGGESSCYAHLLCLECGAVLDGGRHRDGCRSVLGNVISTDASR